MTPQNDNTTSSPSPRKGEQDIPITFRTNRFFTIGNNWYFSTREGIERGPFNTKEFAQQAINTYISEMKLF